MLSTSWGPVSLRFFEQDAIRHLLGGSYLEVHCTYNLLSNCSYNLNISPITTVTPDIVGL